MGKRKYIFLFIIIFILTIFFIANIETTRSIGINYKVKVYNIPIYEKVLDFYNRHNNYKYLIKSIKIDWYNIRIESCLVLLL